MMKRKVYLVLLCGLVLVGFCGCSSNTKELEKRINELEEQIKEEKKLNEKYSLTKEDLVGSWKLNEKQSLRFTEDGKMYDFGNNVFDYEVEGNWITYTYDNEKRCVYFEYRDGTLYIAAQGFALTK